jgi:hypothetical protein
MKRAAILLFVVALLPVLAQGQTFTANLAGANEVPPADPDGSGTAFIVISGTTVFYTITVQNITQPFMQHIHVGPAGVNGPIVVDLPGTFVGGVLSGSTTTDLATASAIIANPSGFYVNVHTNDFPGGAVRGQLVVGANVPTVSREMMLLLAAAMAVAGTLLLRKMW